MSKVILHEALPAILAESPFLQLVLQVAAKVGKLVRGPSAYENSYDLGITRFATNFIALESIVRSKQTLKEMVTSSVWKRSAYARKPPGLKIMEVINSKEDSLNAWIEEREDSTLDSEPNFSWLPEELLNEPDKENLDEETQCDNMDDISPTQSIEESVQLSAPSDGDGDDLGGNNEDACQTEPQHMYSNIFYGYQGMTRYSYATVPDLYETNASISSQHRRVRDDRTHGRMREHFYDSFKAHHHIV
ncbi:hypothetical protein PVK06_047398 [Gossypium arboreum]|uniref:Uncharacterized protein n=1 Tax=Gossypium arboreum TaxID=29729 RepID=A0ABR0MDQ5_GOSAR|nr:hypothetical protein PVK06_047398 [Gossypium arboreum]